MRERERALFVRPAMIVVMMRRSALVSDSDSLPVDGAEEEEFPMRPTLEAAKMNAERERERENLIIQCE